MPLNALSQEILNITGVADDGYHAAIVGDSVSFVVGQTFAAQVTTLTRKPAGSTAVVASNAITCDLAGYYTVTVACGGYTRTITVVAFPSSVLTQKVRPLDVTSPPVSRTALQCLIRDPRVTPTTIGATLEVASPVVTAAIVGGSPFSWSSYAPG